MSWQRARAELRFHSNCNKSEESNLSGDVAASLQCPAVTCSGLHLTSCPSLLAPAVAVSRRLQRTSGAWHCPPPPTPTVPRQPPKHTLLSSCAGLSSLLSFLTSDLSSQSSTGVEVQLACRSSDWFRRGDLIGQSAPLSLTGDWSARRFSVFAVITTGWPSDEPALRAKLCQPLLTHASARSTSSFLCV